MTVTATRRASDAPGGIRNGLAFSTSEALTDKGTASYRAVPRTVTCQVCGAEIPPDKWTVVFDYLNVTNKLRRGKPLCWDCAVGHSAAEWLLPWRRPGARRAGRTRQEYLHRCRWCGRMFIGPLTRRYCSDACGEETRNGRRDRTRRQITHVCVICEATFIPSRADGRYCKPACRQKAYRARLGGAS